MSHTSWLRNHSTIDNSITSAIQKMVNEKGKTCVSIIVPTHRMGQDRYGDHRMVQEAVAIAKQAVVNESHDYLSEIDYLYKQIDFTRNKEGIGIFVSPGIRKLVKFPFPVTRKVIVDKFFLLQDLLYVENYSLEYYVLDISKKEIRLFRGIMDHFEEVNDQKFPQKITDEYEYNEPSQSSSNAGYAHVKSFEKEKSEVEHIRLTKAFREAAKDLSGYFTKKAPVLLCGSEREISIFKVVAPKEANIIGSMSNNYRGAELRDLELLAWLQVRSYIDNQKMVLVDEFKERIGGGLAVYGISDVRKAAIEGRGFKLLVEKDFRIDPDDKYGQYPDAVNEVMSTVLEKNGSIIIVENDILRDYGRIALINRY